MSGQAAKGISDIIEEVSETLGTPPGVCMKAYMSYWKFVKESLESLPLKGNLKEEDFQDMRTSVNVPSLGKFYCDYKRWEGIRKKFEILKKLRKKYGK